MDKKEGIIESDKFYKTKRYRFNAKKVNKVWARAFNGGIVNRVSEQWGTMKIDKGVVLTGIPRKWCDEV